MATKLAVALIRNVRLGNEERQILTSAVLDRLGALPLRDTIKTDGAQILLKDRPVNLGTARKLHEGSKAMLNNYARKFVREQVRFMAIKKGVHENTSPEEGLFAKAALWCFQEEDKIYLAFAEVEAE